VLKNDASRFSLLEETREDLQFELAVPMSMSMGSKRNIFAMGCNDEVAVDATDPYLTALCTIVRCKFRRSWIFRS